jgi:hypothetical protein
MESKQTTPKGTEIPVPQKAEWEKVLRKAANPKDSTTDRPPEK